MSLIVDILLCIIFSKMLKTVIDFSTGLNSFLFVLWIEQETIGMIKYCHLPLAEFVSHSQ